MDAKTIAKIFIDEIVCRYSAPKTLLSDQGAQFMSALLKNIFKNNQTDWDDYLKTALFAYNTSKQETTPLSPFEILNGREPRIPSDLEKIRSERDTFTIDFKNRREKLIIKLKKLTFNEKPSLMSVLKFIGDSVRVDAPSRCSKLVGYVFKPVQLFG